MKKTRKGTNVASRTRAYNEPMPRTSKLCTSLLVLLGSTGFGVPAGVVSSFTLPSMPRNFPCTVPVASCRMPRYFGQSAAKSEVRVHKP